MIAEAIESLQTQTRPPHEILLVIDHSPELEEECRRRWPMIQVLSNREQQGLSGARNTGVAESTGEVVAFLDDDATATSDWVERLGQAYGNPEVLGVGGAVRPAWANGRPAWFPEEFDWVVGCTHSGMPHRPSPVRNPVGANMSFRRDTLVAVGGFRHEMGRVGTILPGGSLFGGDGALFKSGDETELCIRIRQHRPDGVILYDPLAAVDHFVPPTRARLRYFISRCRGEGQSKAVLSALVGSQSGLSEERSYVRRTLPLGFLRDIGASVRGEPAGAIRAAMLGVGLLTTSAGYLSGRHAARRLARRLKATGEAHGADQPLRALMVTPRSPLRQGGVERHVAEVSKRLVEMGTEVEVLCTEPGGPRLMEETRDGVTIKTVRAWPANRDWCLAPRIWREMGRGSWDIVHIQSYHTLVAPLAMLRALRLGVPYVVTFHGGGHSSELRNRLRRTQRRLLRPLLARAARLVAVARFEIDDYSAELRLPASRFALIPNGTDLAFAQVEADRNGSASIASIGRLERYKGHHRVVAAFPEVLRQDPTASLTIVGTGPYEANLRQQVEELGIAARVEFTSTPPDQPAAMAKLLGGISVVVLMSEFETHPLVAIEAAAAGCRLIVADAGGLSELAAEGLARAVPLDESPLALGSAVVEELKQPPMEKRPRVTSWDECAAKLNDLYRSLA